jgi:hypothetical protein
MPLGDRTGTSAGVAAISSHPGWGNYLGHENLSSILESHVQEKWTGSKDFGRNGQLIRNRSGFSERFFLAKPYRLPSTNDFTIGINSLRVKLGMTGTRKDKKGNL